jgi:hypothetical protein
MRIRTPSGNSSKIFTRDVGRDGSESGPDSSVVSDTDKDEAADGRSSGGGASGGTGAEAKGESLTGDGMCLPATLLPLWLKGNRHRTAGQRRYFSQVSTGEYLPSTRTCGPVSSTHHF